MELGAPLAINIAERPSLHSKATLISTGVENKEILSLAGHTANAQRNGV